MVVRRPLSVVCCQTKHTAQLSTLVYECWWKKWMPLCDEERGGSRRLTTDHGPRTTDKAESLQLTGGAERPYSGMGERSSHQGVSTWPARKSRGSRRWLACSA